ncbi:MAG TPA: hypothetical protein G4O08_06585 [Anaerolineae bacterium]|nr:hypothetical protein [Anaerolineae bacterium]
MGMLNQRLGYHYYPDDCHFSQDDLGIWLPILRSLDAQWVTLQSDAKRPIPAFFLRSLLEAGIEPIVHIPCDVADANLSDLDPLLQIYSRCGIRYVVVLDRPNMKARWEYASWSRRGLIERYLDILLPILEAARAAGLRPTLPPLEPGGDYWDTAFLERTLQNLIRLGKHELLEDLTLGTYAWTFDRPLDWGAGGPDRWPEVLPYHTPRGSQDHRGLHIFDWYAAICRKLLPAPLPMLVLAGGACPQIPLKNERTPETQAKENIAIANMLASDAIPAHVLCFNFYPLTCPPDHPEHASSGFPESDHPQPVISFFQGQETTGAALPNTIPLDKPIQHYVLLPEDMGSGFRRRWASLGELALVEKPVVGFSAEEARSAQRVSIMGDVDWIPHQIENDLRQAGCEVNRMPLPADPLEPHLDPRNPNRLSLNTNTGAAHV